MYKYIRIACNSINFYNLLIEPVTFDSNRIHCHRIISRLYNLNPLYHIIRVNVGKICLLVRPKKGKTSLQRMTDLFAGPIFAKARRVDPDFIDKIVLVEGDLKDENLGLSIEDINYITENIQIVLHVAADVRFDQPLKSAILNNVRAVRDVMTLAEKIKKLEVIIYMSTAYSNNEPLIDEKFYGKIVDPLKMIHYVENLDKTNEDIIDILTPRLILPWETTYSFTKALSEELVRGFGKRLPVAIIRPSIVIATAVDPVAGWTDNIYGLNGVLYGFGLGLLRVLWCHPDYVGDVIPADYVANSTLAVAWKTAQTKNDVKPDNEESVKIYNCVSSVDNPATWSKIMALLFN